MGVDDDELLCTTASPTLSSIPVNAEDTGYRFAHSMCVGGLRTKWPMSNHRLFYPSPASPRLLTLLSHLLKI